MRDCLCKYFLSLLHFQLKGCILSHQLCLKQVIQDTIIKLGICTEQLKTFQKQYCCTTQYLKISVENWRVYFGISTMIFCIISIHSFHMDCRKQHITALQTSHWNSNRNHYRISRDSFSLEILYNIIERAFGSESITSGTLGQI